MARGELVESNAAMLHINKFGLLPDVKKIFGHTCIKISDDAHTALELQEVIRIHHIF